MILTQTQHSLLNMAKSDMSWSLKRGLILYLPQFWLSRDLLKPFDILTVAQLWQTISSQLPNVISLWEDGKFWHPVFLKYGFEWFLQNHWEYFHIVTWMWFCSENLVNVDATVQLIPELGYRLQYVHTQRFILTSFNANWEQNFQRISMSFSLFPWVCSWYHDFHEFGRNITFLWSQSPLNHSAKVHPGVLKKTRHLIYWILIISVWYW